MFIAHYATGLAFHMRKPGGKLTFFILVLGTQFVDLLWGLFVLLDIEGGFSGGSVEHNNFDVPWSHSLLMVALWAVVYGFGTDFYIKQKFPELNNFALISGLSVFSHFILDFIVHGDDIRYIPTNDSTVPSLKLWEYPVVAFLFELAIVIVVWYFYWQFLSERDEIGESKKPYIMLAVFGVLHLINYLPSFTDGEGSEADATAGFAVLIMIPLIAWITTVLHVEKGSSQSEADEN